MGEREYNNANDIFLQKRGAAPPDGVTPETIITADGFEILLTKKCIKQIGNMISRQIGKQMTRGEAQELVAFIQALPARRYMDITYAQAQELIVNQFLNRAHQNVREEESVYNIMNMTPHPGDIHEYQRKELSALTTDENPLKLSAFHDSRGNAIIDADRVRDIHIMGNRSSANNVKAQQKSGPLNGSSGSISEKLIETQMATAEALRVFNRFMNSESIDEIFKRSRNTWTTYESVMLPHQVVPLDSRFRLPTHTPKYQYKWYLNTTGNIGSLGNIHMKDTFKEIVRMRVQPFWMPVTNVNNGYYTKIRMLINEFSAQSTESQEFLANGQIRVENFHFEFLITQQTFGRFYLEPTNNGLFTFRKPFARPESITVSFTDPFNEILPTDDSMTAVVSNTNPAVFTTNIPTNLATGDLVYVQLFNSPNPTINTLMNNAQGFIATRLGANTFSVPVDLTSLAGITTGVQVYIASKRLIINIEFTSLEQ